MKLHRTSTLNKSAGFTPTPELRVLQNGRKASSRRLVSGFSVIEVSVVIGLFGMLIALGLLLSMDVWRGSSFQSEQDVVLSLLYKARSRAISNINEHNHGLRIEEDEYILFEVDDDGTTHINEVPFNMGGDFDFPDDTEIVFTARTGETDGHTLTMEGQGKSRTFDINEEGGITW